MRWVSLVFAAVILQSGFSMLVPEEGDGDEAGEASKIASVGPAFSIIGLTAMIQTAMNLCLKQPHQYLFSEGIVLIGPSPASFPFLKTMDAFGSPGSFYADGCRLRLPTTETGGNVALTRMGTLPLSALLIPATTPSR